MKILQESEAVIGTALLKKALDLLVEEIKRLGGTTFLGAQLIQRQVFESLKSMPAAPKVPKLPKVKAKVKVKKK